MPGKTFKSELLKLRPDAEALIKKNERKRKLALALRALRKEKGMTQKDIEQNSNLSQPVISKLESPTGALPNWDTILRYIEACNGHMILGVSAYKLNEEAFLESQSDEGEALVAMAV